MKELPDDLAAVPEDELAEQRAVRDALLTRLFRRWPKLSRGEQGELRKAYRERLRIAKFRGRMRRRPESSSSSSSV